MEGVNNCKYSPHFLMSLRKCAAQLSGNIKQTLESIGIVRKRSRARGSRAGKNRRQKITIIEGHRPKPKHRSKRERVITEICFEKCYSEHSKRERTRMPKLTLCNARSLIKKTDEYELLLKTLDADIGCVTETWAHDNIPDESLSVKDYQLFRRDRTNGKSGGGVAVYCHERLQAKRRKDLESDDTECVWVQLQPRRTPSSVSTIIVGNLYHPPWANKKTHQDRTLEYLINTIDAIKASSPLMGLYLCGDFNKLPTQMLTSSHPDIRQIVKRQTRGQATLDLIFTNMAKLYSPPTTLAPLGSSDHKCLVLTPIDTTGQKQQVKRRRGRLVTKERKEALATCIAMTDWSAVYEAEDITAKAASFNNYIQTAMDICMPVRQKKITTADKPWMTEKIKQAIKKRQKAYNKWGKVGKWREIRNSVQRLIHKAKTSYYKNEMQNLKKKNPKEWWDFINKGLGRTKSPNARIRIQGVEENNAAEALNNFFAKSWTKTTPYCVFPLPRPPTQSDICSIGEMKLALTRLDPRKASGPDGIPTWLLKEQAEDLAPVITHLANCSYQQGCVPDIWKESHVCPIPKGQDPGSISDWRPISLTSCVGKTIERFVLKKLMPTVLDVCKNQYAYLPKHSTTAALVRAMNTWLTETDSKPTMVRVLLADMSKAFDRIDHGTLMQNILDLDLCPSLTAWIHSYITGRRQRVVANGAHSPWIEVTSGVPQGGVVSPYVFLLYMATRDAVFEDTLDVGYADDIGLSRAIPISNIMSDTSMHLEAQRLDEWAAKNKMMLNGKKSVELRICFARDPPQPPPLILGGQEVPVVETAKYLGYHLDQNLTGDVHIEKAIKTASKRLHYLTVMARHGLPADDLITIYTTLIRPCLEYSSVLLVGCSKKQQAELERVQTRACRIIRRRAGNISQPLPSLQTRREEAAVKLVRDMHDEQHPLHDLLPPTRGSCTARTLRNQHKLAEPKAKTSRLKNSALHTAVRLYNDTNYIT